MSMCTASAHGPGSCECTCPILTIDGWVPTIRPLDACIGKLDRLLSEFLTHAADPNIDEADRQTLKHHADDLIGVGQAALKRLREPKTVKIPTSLSEAQAMQLVAEKWIKDHMPTCGVCGREDCKTRPCMMGL